MDILRVIKDIQAYLNGQNKITTLVFTIIYFLVSTSINYYSQTTGLFSNSKIVYVSIFSLGLVLFASSIIINHICKEKLLLFLFNFIMTILLMGILLYFHANFLLHYDGNIIVIGNSYTKGANDLIEKTTEILSKVDILREFDGNPELVWGEEVKFIRLSFYYSLFSFFIFFSSLLGLIFYNLISVKNSMIKKCPPSLNDKDETQE